MTQEQSKDLPGMRKGLSTHFRFEIILTQILTLVLQLRTGQVALLFC